ncbi:MAG TPA: PDZ domain-containing protein, partial [Verrucomicrobiales bacterium]|nr:PDZ domain-containing protein [Verrucomicrobiales bacterium]
KSPSARAGIQVGDRLTSCNGISLRSVIALRLIIQAAEDQELNLLVNREGAQEALSFHVTPVRAAPAAGAVGGGGMVAPGAPSSGAGGGGGIAAPGGGLVIPRMAPYLDELRPVPRMRIERRQDDREVLERLDEVEKVLAHIRELLENAGIGRAEGGGAPEGSSEEGGALDE